MKRTSDRETVREIHDKAINDLEKELSRWMHSSHYHCKECGIEIKCLGRITRTVDDGVRAIGVCENCNLMLVEFEVKQIDWVKIPTKKK